MARLGEIEYRGDGSDPRQLLNYMLQLEEQIKYALAHLGSDNIQAGAIDEKLLAPAVKQKVQNIEIRVEGQERKSRELKSEDGKLRTLILETEEGIMRDMEDMERGLRTTITETAAGINTSINDKLGNYYTKSETATEIRTRLGNALGDYYTKTETAQKIQTDMGDALGNYYNKTETAQQISTTLSSALGDYYTKTETAQKIQTDMGDALGNYYTKTETAGEISTYVSNHTYGLVSGVDITPAGVEISGGKYVRIKSGGSFTVDSGNFSIDAQGNVNFASGTAGSFHITPNYIGSWDDGVYMRKNHYSGGVLLSGGIWVYPNTGNEAAFAAIRNGQVFINGKEISDGWIKDASVSGNTLTLTKWDGTTVNFTKPAGAIGSLLIESVSGYTNRFAANQYNSGDTSVVNAATCEMYLDESTYTRNTWACVREVGGSRAAYLSLSSYWDAAQSDFYEVTQTSLKPEHISIRYNDGRVTVFYDDQTFKVYYESA